jgi:hypothetical protein
MKVGKSEKNASHHYKTSSNSSHEPLSKGLVKPQSSKQLIKSFDSRGGHASSSNKSANVQAGTNAGGSTTGANGIQKRYKSSATSSNCHSSFSNERSKCCCDVI